MTSRQGLLFGVAPVDELAGIRSPRAAELAEQLREFREFGTDSELSWTGSRSGATEVPTWRNEFWTARQRQANPLHEVSYRACFKPALPRFFIERLSDPGQVVLDPFAGRGTTPLEAALLGRVPFSADVNPLSAILLEPRLDPPADLEGLAERLGKIGLGEARELPADLETDGGPSLDDLLTFFHEQTLAQLLRLRSYLLEREAAGELDAVDAWLRMIAVGRLTGHSTGFFSVYTLPPNQAVSAAAQRRINEKRQQRPDARDVASRILRKSAGMLGQVDSELRARMQQVRKDARVVTAEAAELAGIPDGSVDLVVTSPPFLDVVQYAADNWLRCWFCGIDPRGVALTMARRIEDWEDAMSAALRACGRVLRPGGHVAFEVGEVRGGRQLLERSVIDCGLAAGLVPEFVLIQEQEFTKTANCWGIGNNRRGTNTQRVVVLSRESS